jgi:hypothetical protein
MRLSTLALILLVFSAGALGDVATTDPGTLGLYSGGGNIWIGSNSVIQGALASLKGISTGRNVQLNDLLTQGSIWLDSSNVVTGRVLANASAEANSDLTFQGPSWTGGSVWMGRNANVTGDIITSGGMIELGRNAKVAGNLYGNGNIWIDRDSTIYGDAHPGLGDTLSTGKKVTITGSRTPAASPYDTFDLPDLPDAPAHGPYGSKNVYGGAKSITTLDPGAYADVNLWGGSSTLNLSAGTYDLRSLWLGNGGTIHLDATKGDVVLHVGNDFDLGANVLMNKIGDGNLTINLYDNDLSLGSNVTLAGDIRVWGGGFSSDGDLDFAGTIWAADDISIGSGSNYQYVGGGHIPEPGILAILAFGGAGMLWRSRRRPS